MKGLRQDALEKRNVLLHQLFLKVLCAGGNDYATASTKRSSNRGNEIGECFSGSCSRLDDQMSILFKRTHHRPRHFDLAGSIFVFGMRLGDEALRTKDFLHVLSLRLRWCRRCDCE